MRIVLVGAGGVGDAFAKIAVRRSFFERLVVADHDLARAERTVAAVTGWRGPDERFVAAHVRAMISGVRSRCRTCATTASSTSAAGTLRTGQSA